MSPAVDAIGVSRIPRSGRRRRFPAWLPLSGFHGGRLSAGLRGHGMTDARVACRITIAVLAVLPFPLIFRKKKELMGKEREPS
jgi:hypothetical protein